MRQLRHYTQQPPFPKISPSREYRTFLNYPAALTLSLTKKPSNSLQIVNRLTSFSPGSFDKTHTRAAEVEVASAILLRTTLRRWSLPLSKRKNLIYPLYPIRSALRQYYPRPLPLLRSSRPPTNPRPLHPRQRISRLQQLHQPRLYQIPLVRLRNSQNLKSLQYLAPPL